MVNSQYFEIPDFCATKKRQDECTDCLSIFNDPYCAAAFGLTSCAPNNATSCSCHDICVEEVKLIGTAQGGCEFVQCFNYPGIGACRLGADITLPVIDLNVPFRVFVVCAEEKLNQGCQSISVKIRILILATTKTNGNAGSMLLPLDIDVTFDTFYPFPDCSKGPIDKDNLQNALTQIDGSCLVIQLKAEAQSSRGTTQIVVNGKIIDKLWKHENLWVTGIRPYDLTEEDIAAGYVSFTVPDVFGHHHKIGDCKNIACPL